MKPPTFNIESDLWLNGHQIIKCVFWQTENCQNQKVLSGAIFYQDLHNSVFTEFIFAFELSDVAGLYIRTKWVRIS